MVELIVLKVNHKKRKLKKLAVMIMTEIPIHHQNHLRPHVADTVNHIAVVNMMMIDIIIRETEGIVRAAANAVIVVDNQRARIDMQHTAVHIERKIGHVQETDHVQEIVQDTHVIDHVIPDLLVMENVIVIHVIKATAVVTALAMMIIVVININIVEIFNL